MKSHPIQFEIFQQKKASGHRGAGWYWRLRDSNGEIVAVGEAYTRKRDCLRAIENVRDAVANAAAKVQIVK